MNEEHRSNPAENAPKNEDQAPEEPASTSFESLTEGEEIPAYTPSEPTRTPQADSESAPSRPLGSPQEDEDDDEIEERINQRLLVASGTQPTPPWKLSVYAAALGLVVAGIAAVLPLPAQIPLPDRYSIPTLLPLLLLPCAGLAFAAWSIFSFFHRDEWLGAVCGAALSLFAAAVALFAVW